MIYIKMRSRAAQFVKRIDSLDSQIGGLESSAMKTKSIFVL